MDVAASLCANTQMRNSLIALMAEAGQMIMGVYQQDDVGLSIKDDASPVTKADLAAHHLLVAGLSRLTEQIKVVSEEDPASLIIPKQHDVFWLIDPLDGTKEFLQRNGEFTTNLALIEDGRPSLGFVGVPVTGAIYWGGPGLGAHVVEDGAGHPLTTQPKPDGRIRVLASKSHLNEATRSFIAHLDEEVTLIQAGSSLKFLKLALGEADIYPRMAPTCEWDTAAAEAVLDGAGGHVVRLDGQPMNYGKDDILNPSFVAYGPNMPA